MSKAALKPPPCADLYETDFYLWTQEQSKALMAGESTAFDTVNLIDEVESLGRSQRNAIESHLRVLIVHLLKFLVQPERATPSWEVTLRNQRIEIAWLLSRNPSLRTYPAKVLAETYRDAVQRAVQETHLDKSLFPVDSPFTLEQIRDPDFTPR